MKVLVIGASGFVGGALIKYLLNSTDHKVVTLTRSSFGTQDPRLKNRLRDSFSLEQTNDAILADNFQRAARDNHIKKIIYLGSLQPTLHVSSRHLNSRFEVESILTRSKVLLVCFRAGTVLGAGSSFFTIMLRLVNRLPVMICPGWTKTLTQPVDLDDLVVSLTKKSFSINDQDQYKVIDIGFPNSMTYLKILKTTVQELKLKRFFFKVSFFSPGFSKLWVTLLTGAPKALVAPLVETLKYPMILQSENKMTTKQIGDNGVSCIPILNLKLLVLKNVSYQFHENISQLKIVGGILAKKNQKGWLEFRKMIKGLVALSAIHDFTPALPWFVYRLTQSPFNLFVMNSFKKY